MKHVLRLGISIVTFLCCSLGLNAANIFVKKTGNDSYSGLSYALAVKTIKRGLEIANPGDVILVDAGIYNERIIMPKSGMAGAYITLTNYNNGIVYVDGSSGNINSTEPALLTINNKSYLKIYNIQFRNNYRPNAKGIYLYGAGKEYHISNCKFYNIGWSTSKTAVPNSTNNANAILVQGSKADSVHTLTISNNEIYNCITGYSESLTITGNVRNFLIEGNTIHDNTNIGIDIAGHYSWTQAPAAVNVARTGTVRLNTVYNCVFPQNLDVASGIYVDGGKDIHIDRNRCFSNGCGISVGCEVNGFVVNKIQVRGNVVYNNKYVGILFGSNQAGSNVTASNVNNNTLYNNHVDQATYTIYGTEIALQNCSGNTITQNILVPKTSVNVAIGCWNYTQVNNTLKYNLFWRTNGNTSNLYDGVSPDPFAVLGNPKFVAAGTGITANFHILTGSKAINKGNPSFTPGLNELDFDGEARIQQLRCDIGADETNLLSMLEDDLEERADHVNVLDDLSIYPNPSSALVYVFIKEPIISEVRIWNSMGQLIQELNYNLGQSAVSLDCTTWPVGLYAFNLRTTDGQVVTKWIQVLHEP